MVINKLIQVMLLISFLGSFQSQAGSLDTLDKLIIAKDGKTFGEEYNCVKLILSPEALKLIDDSIHNLLNIAALEIEFETGKAPGEDELSDKFLYKLRGLTWNTLIKNVKAYRDRKHALEKQNSN